MTPRAIRNFWFGWVVAALWAFFWFGVWSGGSNGHPTGSTIAAAYAIGGGIVAVLMLFGAGMYLAGGRS